MGLFQDLLSTVGGSSSPYFPGGNLRSYNVLSVNTNSRECSRKPYVVTFSGVNYEGVKPRDHQLWGCQEATLKKIIGLCITKNFEGEIFWRG